MGRKTYLTVRKHRSNERQQIDNRKKFKRPPVFQTYVIHENTDDLPGTEPITDLAGIALVTNNLPGITDHLLGTTPSTGESTDDILGTESITDDLAGTGY